MVFRKGGPLFALSYLVDTVNPFSATIQSSILPIPCKTLSPSPLPCYPLPCITALSFDRPLFPPREGSDRAGKASNPILARQVVFLTPTVSHPRPSLSYKQHGHISSLAATHMDLFASVANKRLTAKLTPLAATLTKNRGEGWIPIFKPANRPAIRNFPSVAR
jgi:hypothetical protein